MREALHLFRTQSPRQIAEGIAVAVCLPVIVFALGLLGWAARF